MSLKNAIPLNDEKASPFIKILLLGESKTGKTTALKTFPGKKLALGLSTRTRSALAGTENIDLIEIMEREGTTKKVRGSVEYSIVSRAWDEVWNTVEELWTLPRDPFPYSAIMLDDLTAAVDFSMNHVLSLKKKDGSDVPKGLAGAPAEQHYMPQMSELTRMIYHRLLPLPCHVLICGHIAYKENPDTGVSAYYPKVYGNLREHIASWFDEVYETSKRLVRTKSGPDKVQYEWITQSYGLKKFIGSTIYKGSSPLVIDLTAPRTGFAEILSQVKGGDQNSSD